MVNPDTILDALVTMLKTIPGLVTAMGSASNIVAVYDEDQTYPSIAEAIASMTPPKMILFWEATSQAGVGRSTVWSHQFRAAFKPKPNVSKGASGVFNEFVDGVPSSGGGMKMYLTRILPSCYEMDPPSISRAFLPLQSGGVEYFEIRFSIKERGM